VTTLLAAVEAGGTKYRAAVVSPELDIVAETRIPTTTPDETLGAVEDFFAGHDGIAALGIASFGPLVVDRASDAYGSIAATPKPSWAGAPVLSRLQSTLGVPADIETDVEAAAVAEWAQGAGQGYPRVAYVTIGTGIGAAIAIGGRPFRGRDHTELGHIPATRIKGDGFPGRCPFHRDCLEGMASGPAIGERWGADPETLDGRDDVWDLEAAYLAQLVRVFTYGFAPDIVVFGGGVGTRSDMADRIRTAVARDEAGYAASGPPIIATAGLGEDAGLIGAARIAKRLTLGD
jgi:fructokinase